MMTELNIAGVYVAPIVGYVTIAAILFLLCRWILTLTGFWRFVWHPGLFEVSLFLSILSLVVFSFP
ncbi:MAG: DUF1656 domain-containing protein [Dongiaceae bacterium]